MAKSQAPWFKHDKNSMRDNCMAKLLAEEGHAGIGLFWMLVEYLHEQPNGAVAFREQCDRNAVAMQLFCDIKTLEKFVKTCTDTCKLLFIEDGLLSSHRVRRNLDESGHVSETARENARKRWDAGALRRQSGRNAIRVDKSRVDKNIVDTNDAATQVDSTLHPSPSAPKQLTRKPDELKPYPTEQGPVWLTEPEYGAFCDKWGTDETNYLIQCMVNWRANNPQKFGKRKDHARTLITMRQKSIGEGKLFFKHPEHGAAYFKAWQVDEWKKTL